jgi:hypothetical protein
MLEMEWNQDLEDSVELANMMILDLRCLEWQGLVVEEQQLKILLTRIFTHKVINKRSKILMNLFKNSILL